MPDSGPEARAVRGIVAPLSKQYPTKLRPSTLCPNLMVVAPLPWLLSADNKA